MASNSIPRSATPEHLLCRIFDPMMSGSKQHTFSLLGHRSSLSGKRIYHKSALSAIAGFPGDYDDIVSDIVVISYSQQQI
eukprot:15329979-Ditylum_brightwellii.AAC.1